jgi:D-3-phosphoglycerate dehydrogenase / 2-oxoglutarate reductase
MNQGSDAFDVLVSEDIWGSPFDVLAKRVRVRRDPSLYADRRRLEELVRASRALVVRNRTNVDRELLQGAPGLALVARAGAGLDNIDVDAAQELGVVVVSAAGANARSVGELAIGLAICLARGIVRDDREIREGRWRRSIGTELQDLEWGVVGFGQTGQATGMLARALCRSVVAFDPAPGNRGVLGEHEIPLVPLEELLARADVVSVHVPLAPATRGMVNADFIGAMKVGALLVNVSRGEVVDESALAESLRSKLSGAGLDVRAEEPPRPSLLDELPNVIYTSHIGGLTDAAQRRVLEVLAADIENVLNGGDASHAVGTVKRARHARPGVPGS